MHWLRENWQAIVAAAGALSAVCTVINATLPKDENGYVKRPPSWPVFFWRVIVDLLALTPQPGKAGIFGPVPINLPLIASFNTPPTKNGVNKAVEPPPLPPAALLLFGIFALPGCYCWEAAHVQEPKCVVAHQVVDCTSDAVKSAAGYLLPILTSLISAGQFNAEAAENFAKVVGFRDLGCALAALENDFATAKASPATPMRREVLLAHATFVDWRARFHPDVRFRLAPGVER